MPFASLLSAGLACGSGLWAALEWWKASRIPVVPAWGVEPGEATNSMQGWIAAIMVAADKSNRQNARAAIWTGASVALSGLAAFLGAVKL